MTCNTDILDEWYGSFIVSKWHSILEAKSGIITSCHDVNKLIKKIKIKIKNKI